MQQCVLSSPYIGEYKAKDIKPMTEKPVNTYGMLQHCLITGESVYMPLTYGRLQQALISKETVLMDTIFPDTPVTIIYADGYSLGVDGISRVTVFWNHPSFSDTQIDMVELDRLYIKSEE